MIKRVFYWFIIFSLLIGAINPCFTAYSAELNGLSVSDKDLIQGEEFEIYIDIPASSEKADTASLKVEFDSSAFEVKNWSPVIPGGTIGMGDGYFTLAAANAERKIDLSNGLTLTAIIKVKSTAKNGSYDFKLTKSSFSYVADNGYDYVELWSPAVKSVAVKVNAEPTVVVPRKDDITVSKSDLEPNDEFKVYINVPASSEKADTASLKVEFDSSAFEVKNWSPVISGGTTGKGDGYFTLAAANAERKIDLSNGLTLTAIIKVKSTAKNGSYDFKLTKSSFSYVADNGYDYVELWSPAVKKATVKVTVPAEVTTPTTTTTPDCDSSPPEDEKPEDEKPEDEKPENENPEASTDATTTTTPKYPSDSPAVIVSSSNITTTPPEEIRPPITTTPPGLTTPPTGFSPNPGIITSTTPVTTTAETTTKKTTTTKKPVTEEVSDDESIYDEESDGEEDAVNKDIKISLSRKLKNLSKGKVAIATRYRFFVNDTTIILSHTDDAAECGEEAAENLELENHLLYTFDISVYDEEEEDFIYYLENDGYIDFTMPLPKELSKNPSALKVYHTESGYPELMESEIVTEGGVRKIRFRADSFSPYMIIDTVNKQESIPEPDDDIITDMGTETPTTGNVNPNTGAAVAIVIPSALVGCMLLVKKSGRKRGKNRKV